MWNFKNWKTAMVLSVVIPISFLTTFRITGILNGPLTISETTQLEPILWKAERPNCPIINFNKTVVNSDSEDNFLFASSIKVGHYCRYRDIFWGSESLELTVNFSASLNRGFIETGKITFTGDYNQSWLNLFGVSSWPKYFCRMENLSLVDYSHHLFNDNYKGHIELKGTDRPRQVQFSGFVDWVLRTPRNQTEHLGVVMELIYYDGEVYRKITQPFILEIEPGSTNDSFDNAQNISIATHDSLYIDTNHVDYYNFYLEQGDTIHISAATRNSDPLQFNLSLCDPNRNLVIITDYARHHSVEYTADTGGYWFIKISPQNNGLGFYSLGLSVLSDGGD